jgi:hypothetical protein
VWWLYVLVLLKLEEAVTETGKRLLSVHAFWRAEAKLSTGGMPRIRSLKRIKEG